MFPEGWGAFSDGFRHSVGPTGGRDVSDCVHHGVGIAVFSGGFRGLMWRIAECTFGL